MTDKETLMIAGKARWLLEGGAQELSDDERVLLLALAQLELDSGRQVTDEEREALDRIAASVEGVDTHEITKAVDRMISAKPKAGRKMDWSELKKRIKRD